MATSRYNILEIDLLLKKGVSIRGIARHYGVEHGSILGWLRRNKYRVIQKRYIDPDTLKGIVIVE